MSFDIADDIDAAFDSIVLVEDNLVQSGFKEGYLQVQKLSDVENGNISIFVGYEF